MAKKLTVFRKRGLAIVLAVLVATATLLPAGVWADTAPAPTTDSTPALPMDGVGDSPLVP